MIGCQHQIKQWHQADISHVQLPASLGQPEILTLNHSDSDLVSKFAVLKDMRVCQK